MMPNLLKRLRLLEAWRKPAGPTPKEKMPNTYKTVKEAADALETLMDHAEALQKAAVEAVIPLEAMILGGTYQAMCPEMQDGVRNGVIAVRQSLAAFRAAFPEVNDADPA